DISSELIKRGLHYGMLTARREIIEQTIDALMTAEGVKAVRIFDTEGRIFYSSNREDVGKLVDKQTDVTKSLSLGRLSNRERAINFIKPIPNEPACYTAPCHRHSSSQSILGFIETSFSTASVDSLIRKNRINTIIYGASFIALISVVLCFILWKFVSKPLGLLEEGMKNIAKGNLDHRIDIKTKDEMGLLAQTFNSMAQELKESRQKLEQWTKCLEEEVEKKTLEIKKAQEQLINAEKLASLGRMAAGFAHELNSPLTGIITFAHLIMKKIPEHDKELREEVQVIIDQAERCSKIIKGLLGFARKTGYEKTLTDINSLIERTVMMVKNQAKFHNIEFKLDLDRNLPSITVDAHQIEQVFLNLLINAADAMNERGTITIASRIIRGEVEPLREQIELEFTDTGPGIPEEYLSKIFEPFFTTKPPGKGTGLGLSVSYGIIKRHGGTIFVKSVPGKGASFFIRLPVKESENEIKSDS
ncbi:MAG: ATP-binding protein, partial [Thermodesulfovibrionales bacterium]|nr:ATP-binding protein [Thermodesulfovibrionales bacterium]